MVNLTGIRTFQPTEAQGYLTAAKGMFLGAKPLADISPKPPFAITLLCGHTCEASLKAMLSEAGLNVETLSRAPYGHDILSLWEESKNRGYPLPAPQPEWVVHLHQVYDRPFHLRYPLGFHGIVLPNQNAMLQGTESLLSIAVSAVK